VLTDEIAAWWMLESSLGARPLRSQQHSQQHSQEHSQAQVTAL